MVQVVAAAAAVQLIVVVVAVPFGTTAADLTRQNFAASEKMKPAAAVKVLVAASDAEDGMKASQEQTSQASVLTTVVVTMCSGSRPVARSEPTLTIEGL